MALDEFLKKSAAMLYEGICTVEHRVSITDADTHMTKQTVETVLIDEPCRVSYGTAAAADGYPLPAAEQSVKLFISPDAVIPPGSRITVTQHGRTVVYARAGQPAVYTGHQEIALEKWEGWI